MKRLSGKKPTKKPFDKSSHLEEALILRLNTLCTALGLPFPLRNQRYLPPTDLEFDFSWLDLKIAIEVQGGIYKRGRRTGHVSPTGMRRDMYKMCLAQSVGWIIYQVQPDWVTIDSDYRILEKLLRRAFKIRGAI